MNALEIKIYPLQVNLQDQKAAWVLYYDFIVNSNLIILQRKYINVVTQSFFLYHHTQ